MTTNMSNYLFQELNYEIIIQYDLTLAFAPLQALSINTWLRVGKFYLQCILYTHINFIIELLEILWNASEMVQYTIHMFGHTRMIQLANVTSFSNLRITELSFNEFYMDKIMFLGWKYISHFSLLFFVIYLLSSTRATMSWFYDSKPTNERL